MNTITFKEAKQMFQQFSIAKKVIVIIAVLQLLIVTAYIVVLNYKTPIEILFSIISTYTLYIVLPYHLYVINNTNVFYINPKDWNIK